MIEHESQLTDAVIEAMARTPDARLCEVIAALVRHARNSSGNCNRNLVDFLLDNGARGIDCKPLG